MLKYQFNLQHSKSLPYPSENFVGRDQEIQELLDLLNYEQSDIRIVNIIGSPGFGKSTLAIHVGHRLMKMGVVIHYVNMAELLEQSVDQLLAEKVLQSTNIIAKRVTFDRLEKWARDRYWYNLLILDNCDDALNQQKDTFQVAVEKLVRNSLRLKVLMTSREVTMFLDYFRSYSLYEISTKAACHLLKLKVPATVRLNETQEGKIAKLTGNVPLALQIISSLLELPSSPSPNTIIEELQKEPIVLLSPKELLPSQQVNASITLSYKYLSPQQRIVGQFYANFPGSFSETAAYSVFVLSNQTNPPLDVELFKQEQQNVTFVLNSLVRRSLLGYNQRTGRYQFHRLIREYFLEAQKFNKEATVSIKRLCAGFNIYYASVMMDLSEEFVTNYAKSLTRFDTERHNFQLLLEYLKEPNLLVHHKAFVFVVSAVSRALDSGLMFCRFTCEDMVEPLGNGLNDLRKHSELFRSWINTHPEVIDASSFYESIYLLVSHLAKCKGQSNPTTVKLNIFLDYKEIFDLMRPNKESVAYTMFYKTLATYYLELGMEKEYIESHRILLEHTKKQAVSCEPGTCDYHNIAYAYIVIGDSEKAVHFFEQSLEHSESSAFEQVHTLCTLHLHYNKLNNEKMILKTKDRLETLLTEDFIKVPDIHFYQCSCMTTSIIQRLRQIEMNQQALKLEEKLLKVIRTIGAPPERTVSLEQAFGVVKYLYDDGNYTSAVDLGQFTLNSFLQNMNDEQRQNSAVTISHFQLLIGLAKFHGGNYSDGWKDIEEVLIDAFKQPNPDAEIYETACLYLIPRLKYINKCYVYKITETIFTLPLTAGVVVVHVLFAPVLEVRFNDIFADQQKVKLQMVSPSAISTYPEIGFLSSSTDVSATWSTLTGNEVADFLVEQIFSPIYSVVVDHIEFSVLLTHAKHIVETIFKNPIFRIVVNTCSVCGRLIQLYLLFKTLSNLVKTRSCKCLRHNCIMFFFSLKLIYLYGVFIAFRILLDPRFDIKFYVLAEK